VINSQELELIFDKKFKIIDPYNMNGVSCDISTLNSAFVVNQLKQKPYFKDIPFVIYNAPLDYGTESYFDAQKNVAKVYVSESNKCRYSNT
jgi:hypothetical protein